MKTNQEMLARMEVKTDVNLKEMKEAIRTNRDKMKEDIIRTNPAKVDATLKEMKEELKARPEAEIQAEIKTNNDKFEVNQSTLVSRLDIYQARTLTTQAEMKAKTYIKRGQRPQYTPSGPSWRRPSNIGRKTSCHVSNKGRRASARN
jgi:DNA replicative helicase MCM subunit Mcm2 (Cdc46/Mcm family)